MSSASWTVLVVVIVPTLITLLLAPPICVAQLPSPTCKTDATFCWSCSNIDVGSAYQNNLNKVLLTDISSSTQTVSNDYYFFRNASSGESSDKVNAVGLCRGDLMISTCHTCLNDTSRMVLKECPRKNEAILWGQLCMVRYSNSSIISVKVEEPIAILPNPAKATDTAQFKAQLVPLLNRLTSEAASSSTKFKYGGGPFTNADPVYALVQCTPDLSQIQCSACLNDSISKIPEGNLGARILKPSCTLRFESGDPFYNKTESSSNTETLCSQNSDFCWSCYGLREDSNSNNAFQGNLRTILSSLSNKNIQNPYGFYNLSLGENQDRVSLIAMCRGDQLPDACQSCLHNSSQRLISGSEYCPNRKKAIAWEERCMVRYSNESIFSFLQEEPRKNPSNPDNVTQQESFIFALDGLLSNISREAASGDSQRKYSSGKTDVEGYEGIHATAQCTPDLDEGNCSSCLQDAVSTIQKCCQGKKGVKILKPSCVLRYEVNKFYGPTVSITGLLQPSPPPDSDSTTQGTNGRTNKRNIIIGVVASVSAVLLICVFIFLKLRRNKTHHKHPTHFDEITGAESLQYDLSTIRTATDNFSEENKLGRGGFGDVYRGRLTSGQLIAVKRLSKTSDQGDKEFKNEVTLLAKLQHRNLVKFLGFCLDDKETLLVYEFVPNSSLDKYIFNPAKRAQLDWDRRHKIINGIARGLLYIHEDSRLKIIHCDLKAGNILLDDEMNPKISDFGMARLFALDETQGNTKKAAGTYGYMAPEYAIQGHFSVKSDVFSFGVLLLEIINGQKIGFFCNEEEDQGHLLTYAWKYWSNGTALNLIDPVMTVGSGTEEIMKCIHIGLLCVQENLADRPTMNLVVHMLNSRSHETLAVPTKPGFFMGSNAAQLQNRTTNGSTQVSVDDSPITELLPRD